MIAAQIVAADGEYSLERGISTFSADANESSETSVTRIIDTIADHHAEWEHDPPMTVLEIYGAKLSPAILEAAAAVGLPDVSDVGDHLVCKAGSP